MGGGSGAWGADASISSPNMRPLVVVDAHTGAVHVDRLAVLAPPKGRLRVHLSMEARMVVIKMVPNVDLAPLVRLASVGTDTCRAIILELYGTGNAPKLAPRLVEGSRRRPVVRLHRFRRARERVERRRRALDWLPRLLRRRRLRHHLRVRLGVRLLLLDFARGLSCGVGASAVVSASPSLPLLSLRGGLRALLVWGIFFLATHPSGR